MSKLFFDHLVELKEIDREIKKIAKTAGEREELWGLVDEIIHHKVMGCILDRLPREHHEEFLELYTGRPHDEKLLFDYLKEKVGADMEEVIRSEMEKLSVELLGEIHPHTKKQKN